MRRLLGAVFAVTLLTTAASAESPRAPRTTSPEPAAASAPYAAAGQPPMTPQAASLYLPPGALDPREPCCEEPRVWGRVEGLMWWAQGSRTPPLVTSGSNPSTVLFGGSRLNDDLRGGVRTELGVWLGDNEVALQGGYFFLGPDQSFARFGSPSANQTIGRPFLDANTGQPVFQQVTTPGTLAGFATVSSSTSGIMGADALLRVPLCCRPICDGGYRFDLLAGYRYFALNDQLAIRENLAPTAAPFVTGTQLTVLDSFRTQNDFHGGSLGGSFVAQSGPFSAQLTGRVDLGAMNRTATIFGATRADVPGLPSLLRPGGLLAQTSNIGTYRSSSFTVIPEFDLRLGYRVTEWLSVTVGYSFLLLTDVARAGDQIDLVLNPNLLPGAPNPGVGPARPAFVMRQTNTWVQGISLGVLIKW